MAITAEGIFDYLKPLSMTSHDGCAYSTVECLNQGCKPAELCPAGYQVYRNWTGGGYHHEENANVPVD